MEEKSNLASGPFKKVEDDVEDAVQGALSKDSRREGSLLNQVFEHLIFT